MTSNTGSQQARRPGTFVKGDPRINRKGRPKSFDALRTLAQALAHEIATGQDAKPIVRNGELVTQVQAILLKMMHDNPERFLEIAFGKVPQPVDVTSGGKSLVAWKDFVEGDSHGDGENGDTNNAQTNRK